MNIRGPLVVLALAGALAGCDARKEAAHQDGARPVLVASVHYAPKTRVVALPGIVKARIESEMSFRVGGRIERRLVDVGAFVRKGDALAGLDDADLKLQAEQAGAELASARSALTQAEAEEKRFTTLNRQGWAANSDFDKIHAAADQARNNVVKAERAVSLARNALSYGTLTADADGIVSAVEAEPGQVVAAGAPVLRLARAELKEAAVAVPENLVDRARASSAGVEFWALPGVSTKGVLRELSPNADPATRTYSARFSLLDAPAGARLGMSVTVSMADEAADVARVPAGAVFDEGRGPEVWTVDRAAGSVTPVRIVVASYDADSAYVASGLPEGAEIVALGVHKLDAKQKVRVVENLAGL